MLGDPFQHFRANLNPVVESPGVIVPTLPGEDLMGTAAFSFHAPTDSEQSGKDHPRLCRRPLPHDSDQASTKEERSSRLEEPTFLIPLPRGILDREVLLIFRLRIEETRSSPCSSLSAMTR